MANQQLIKVQAATANEVCAYCPLDEMSQALLRNGMSPRGFLESLVANKQYAAGIQFLAHALPAREAIWWGCLCTQHACGSNPSLADRAACTAAVQWVMRPTEQNRAAAKEPGEAARAPSPAGALAIAVSLTGGSLGPPSMPPIPPPPFAWARYVAAAVKFAAVKAEPSRISEMHRLFLELGTGVAEGRYT
jgi:hypothetical protein